MNDITNPRTVSSVTTRPRSLPDFDDPPVVETVMGLEFVRLKGWSIPHFGLLWSKFKSEYPHFDVQPALQSNVDVQVGVEVRTASAPTVSVMALPSLRCWFFDESRTSLIQVQEDRFLHNWIKKGSQEKYPHYENIRPKFEIEWQRFCAFLSEQNLATPVVQHCEVTYVNHIERGAAWRTFDDLADVVSVWSKPSTGFLPSPDAVNLSVKYPMQETDGTLTITLEPAIRHTDQKEVLQLRLSAHARPASQNLEDILKCLDIGRDWIVRGFTDFTSSKAHSLWKRSI
ncbi:MAG TPA: TIGR04255 family protein [Candidatus Angelobacter sp.]